jgi:hypothetical protein
LRHYTLEQLDKAAADFARKIKADEKLFVRAARVARDPPGWSNVDGITKAEEDALKDEKNLGFWKQPKTLRTTIITLVFSAITHGWIQSVSNGANQTMPESLGLKSRCGDHAWKDGAAIRKFAGINAVTYLSAGIFGQ